MGEDVRLLWTENITLLARIDIFEYSASAR